MRDEYAGDVSDVDKFALLCALAGADRTLGIARYYAPGDDGRADGRHPEWRDEAAWRLLDAQLHAVLATLPDRSIAALEQAAIWLTGALFHREPMPSRVERSARGMPKRSALNGADVVFLDLDNGVDSETEKHDALLQQLHERLTVEADVENVITLRTNVSVPRATGSRSYVQRQRWFTIVDPDAELTARAQALAKAIASAPRVRARLDGTA